MTDDEKEVLEVMKRIAKAIGKCRPSIAATACLNIIKTSLMVEEANELLLTIEPASANPAAEPASAKETP